jgi:hypothetical protein
VLSEKAQKKEPFMSISVPPIVAEVLSLYDVTDDAETRTLMGDLLYRGREIENSGEPGYVRPAESVVRAQFAYFVEVGAYAEYVCSLLGIDVDATVEIGGDSIPVYDFSVLAYDDFIDEKTLIATAFAIAIPDIKAAFPVFLVAFQADVGREVLSKLLAALGVKEVHQALLETFEAVGGTLVEDLGKAVRAREWGRVRTLLIRLLNLVKSKKFFQTLASKIGETAAKKVIGKVLARFIPFVGWALLIGSFVWAVAEEVW